MNVIRQTYGNTFYTKVEGWAAKKATTFILTLSVCALMVQEFVPALWFVRDHNTLWKIAVATSFVISIGHLYEIRQHLPKEGLLFLMFLALLSGVGTLSDTINTKTLSWSSTLSPIVCLGAFSLAWRRKFDPGLLMCLLTLLLAFLAALLPISSLNELQVQRYVHLNGTIQYLPKSFEVGSQWYGISGSPNATALAAIYPFLYFLPFHLQHKRAATVLCSFLLLCLIFSGARGATLAMLCGLCYLLLRQPRFYMKSILISILTLCIGILLISATGLFGQLSILEGRFSSDKFDYDLEGRQVLLSNSVRIILAEPLIGSGVSGYSSVGISSSSTALGAHIWFLELGVVYGIFYTILVCILCLRLFVDLNRCAGREPLCARYAAISLAIVIYSFGNGLMSHYLQWALIGYGYGLVAYCRKRKHPSQFRIGA